MELGKKAGLKPYDLPLRNVFGDALLNVARENEKVVVLDGDLGNSTKTEYVRQEFPERRYSVLVELPKSPSRTTTFSFSRATLSSASPKTLRSGRS